jgi:predicted DNA-binding transcriptional regulator YafY
MSPSSQKRKLPLAEGRPGGGVVEEIDVATISPAACDRRGIAIAGSGAETGRVKGSEREPRRADSAQLVRQWAILRLLAESGRAFSVKELADQLGASKATIQRDLATLEKDFALVEEAAGKQKLLYRIDQKIRALEAIQFGTMELLAVHAALAGLPALAATPLGADLAAVASKLRGFLSPRHNGGLDALSRVFLPHARGQVDYSQQSEVIDALTDAVARRRVCRIVYFAAWKRTTREHRLRPYRLVWHRSSLYVLGALGDKTDIATLAVHRIRDIEPTDETFPAPRADTDAHARKAFGIFVSTAEEEVEILFEPDIAWRIEERTYHPDETKERQGDGRLLYRVRSSAQWEIIPWVLSFGSLATLVRPEPWRAAIAELLAHMTPRYTR